MPVPAMGRKKGDGDNIRLLQRLKKGESLWNVSLKKAQSFRCTALRLGLKIRCIRIPGTDVYAVERIYDAS